MKLLLQSEASECGLACLGMAASHYGYDSDLTDLRRRFSVSLKGATLAQLIRHAAAMHLSSRPLRVELADLSRVQLPCVLHWNLNHFVILKKVSKTLAGREVLTLLDPAVGERTISLKDASHYFTGVVLELTPTPDFRVKDERKKIELSDLTGHIVGLRRALIQVVALALALELFVMAAPLFNQFMIDEAIVSGDRELLAVMAIGFTVLIFIQTAIGLARSWLLMRWSMDISFQWARGYFPI